MLAVRSSPLPLAKDRFVFFSVFFVTAGKCVAAVQGEQVPGPPAAEDGHVDSFWPEVLLIFFKGLWEMPRT